MKRNRRRPYVCQAIDVPGQWAGDWLLVTKHGTGAHRTRDGAYRMLHQYKANSKNRGASMKYHVILENVAGKLDETFVITDGDDDTELCKAVVEFVEAIGALRDGDVIRIAEIDEIDKPDWSA